MWAWLLWRYWGMDSPVSSKVYTQVETALSAARRCEGWELDLAWWDVLETHADAGYAAVGYITGYVVGEYFDALDTEERGAKECFVLAREATGFAAGWYSLEFEDFERVVGALFCLKGSGTLLPFDGAPLLVMTAALLRSGVSEETLVRAKSVALGGVLT